MNEFKGLTLHLSEYCNQMTVLMVTYSRNSEEMSHMIVKEYENYFKKYWYKIIVQALFIKFYER